jgi:Na+/H+ antiporter NhaD/arsenite permease-like protein
MPVETVMITAKGWVAVAIFVISYIFIATDKFDRAMVAVVGAAIMLISGIVDQSSAFNKIDLNVVFLLAGMMITINIIKRSGLFEWLALSTAKLTGQRPILMLITLATVTALTSAFLDNVTTIILIAPITLLIADTMRINPVPLLLAEVIASNIGGTATMIGDPPHILIGSAANLNFLDFLNHMTPVVALILVIFLIMTNFSFSKKLRATPPNLSALGRIQPSKAIKDRYLLWKSVAVLACVFTMFIFHHRLHIHPDQHMQPATIALIGASALLILSQLPPRQQKVAPMDVLLAEIDWPTLFFFMGMFIMISGLQANGVIGALVNLMMGVAKDQLLLTCILIIWGSAAITMVTSAVPFVIALIPVIQGIIANLQGMGAAAPPAGQLQALWWALALGAALGSNGTFIGSAANMVVVGISNRSGYKITFKEFSKRGLPITIISLILSTVYIWLRYFVFKWY